MSGGMLTKKRPGVEYFLAQLAQNYEIVLFTLQPISVRSHNSFNQSTNNMHAYIYIHIVKAISYHYRALLSFFRCDKCKTHRSDSILFPTHSLTHSQTFGPVMEKLDPNHHAMHRLFVDATTLSDEGRQIKDLALLDRPIEKVCNAPPPGGGYLCGVSLCSHLPPPFGVWAVWNAYLKLVFIVVVVVVSVGYRFGP